MFLQRPWFNVRSVHYSVYLIVMFDSFWKYLWVCLEILKTRKIIKIRGCETCLAFLVKDGWYNLKSTGLCFVSCYFCGDEYLLWQIGHRKEALLKTLLCWTKEMLPASYVHALTHFIAYILYKTAAFEEILYSQVRKLDNGKELLHTADGKYVFFPNSTLLFGPWNNLYAQLDNELFTHCIW